MWKLRRQRPGWNEPAQDNEFTFGSPGDTPVVGDWKGDGVQRLGTWRAGTWSLSAGLRFALPETTLVFGAEGDKPVVGDWDGNGSATVGVFRAGTFSLRNSNDGGPADLTILLGKADDLPLAGDWDGDGDDTVGIYTPSTGVFRLLAENRTGATETVVPLGIRYAEPVAGDWDGDGRATVGVREGAEWTLLNHLRALRRDGKPFDFQPNGERYSLGEITVQFDAPGTIPVTGNWFPEIEHGHPDAPAPLHEFFPLAIDHQDPSTFAKWQALGINTVIRVRPEKPGTPPSDLEKTEWTRKANELGLKMIREPFDTPTAEAEEANLLAYTLYDEPDIQVDDVFDEVKNQVQAVRAVSQRPLFVNFAGWSVLLQNGFRARFGPGDRNPNDFYSRFVELEDWASQDIYAISQNAAVDRTRLGERDAMNAVSLTLDKLRRWTPGKPQFAFIESSQSDISRRPELTRHQFRAQTWSALVHGVRGIFYFPHGDCGGVDPCLSDDAMTDALRDEMKQQNALITKLANVLQEVVNPNGWSVTADEPLQVGWRSAFAGDYVIAVNYSTRYVERWLRLDRRLTDRPIEVVDEDRTLEALGGYVFSDIFEPYAVHIYKVP